MNARVRIGDVVDTPKGAARLLTVHGRAALCEFPSGQHVVVHASDVTPATDTARYAFDYFRRYHEALMDAYHEPPTDDEREFVRLITAPTVAP